MGDAAHATVPFYGQGMNAGFEDCTVLNEVETRKDVKLLLSSLVRNLKFERLYLIKDSIYFSLSVQGGASYSSEPKEDYETLSKYTMVEVKILPDFRNEKLKYKKGYFNNRLAKDRQGYLNPSHINFHRLQKDNNSHKLSYQLTNNIIEELVNFFMTGGRLDLESMKDWLNRKRLYSYKDELENIHGLFILEGFSKYECELVSTDEEFISKFEHTIGKSFGNIPESIGNNFDLVEKKFEDNAMGDKTKLNE
jgi:hypothetical protein